MAKNKLLSILTSGVSNWNRWRELNPSTEIDLEGAYLRGAELRGANLADANLRRANLQQASLQGAILENAYLQSAFLQGAKLKTARLSRSNCQGAHLNHADLRRTNLLNANLCTADLEAANLIGASLQGADLARANLRRTVLRQAVLEKANLKKAFLEGADLKRARLNGAGLNASNLKGADLRGANLERASLVSTYFFETKVEDCDFSNADFYQTVIAATEISSALGLELINHRGPSTLGSDTISLSRGNLPDTFLRGCGLSDWQIKEVKLHKTGLSNDEIIDIQNEVFAFLAGRPIQISSLFISYSHKDSSFVEKVEQHFDSLGIRYWRDEHHATSGRLEKIIDRAIRLNPTVLLVLSKHSIESDWVEFEVSNARELEKKTGRDILCPVALDDEWQNPKSWSRVLMNQVKKYNILDFSDWSNEVEFSAQLGRLISGLKIFYGRTP